MRLKKRFKKRLAATWILISLINNLAAPLLVTAQENQASQSGQQETVTPAPTPSPEVAPTTVLLGPTLVPTATLTAEPSITLAPTLTATPTATPSPTLTLMPTEVPTSVPLISTPEADTVAVTAVPTISPVISPSGLWGKIKGLFDDKDLKENKPKVTKANFRSNESMEIVLGDYQDKQLTISLFRGEELIENIETKIENGNLKIGPPRNFKPGKYTIKISTNDTKDGLIEQDFTWGVLAINSNKSIYTPGEEVKFAISVLDDRGAMVCDANLKLTIRNEKLKINDELSTQDGTIKINPECRLHEYTHEIPDYEAQSIAGEEGVYQLELTAETKNGSYTISDGFVVAQTRDFDVERVTTTRIYPPIQYPVTLSITANKDFTDTVKETVPSSFEISPLVGSRVYDEMKENGDTKIISWNVSVSKGEKITLGYYYIAPPETPQFYALGPLKFEDKNGIVFQEARKWQVAVDATCTSTGSGLWHSAIWSGCSGTYPVAGEDVIVASGHTITIGASAAASSLTIAATSTTRTVGLSAPNSASISLDLSGNVTITTPGTNSVSSTLDAVDGTINIGGNLYVGGATGGTGKTCVAKVNNGIFNIAGSVIFNGTSAAREQFTVTGANAKVYIGGDFRSGGALATSGLGTFYFNGSGNQTIGIYITYSNIVINNSASPASVGVGLTGATTFGGTLSLLQGRFNTGIWAFAVTGAATVGVGSSLNITSTTGSKAFNGGLTIDSGGVMNFSAAESITDGGSLTNNGIISGAQGTWTFSKASGGVLNGSSNTTLTSATFSTAYSVAVGSTYNITSYFVLNAILTNNGILSVNAMQGDVNGGLVQGENSYFNLSNTNNVTNIDASASGNTFEYSGGVQGVVGATYHNLISGGNNVKTAGNDITVNGDFTISGSSYYQAGAYTHTFYGNWILNTTTPVSPYNPGSSVVTFNTPTTPAATSIDGTTSETVSLSRVNFNNTSGFNINKNVSIGNTATVGAGATVTPAAEVTVAGAGTLTGTGAVQVTRITATADFANQYTISKKITDNLTVDYVGTSAQTVNARTYGNLLIRPGADSITHTLAAGTMAVNGDIVIGDGTHTGAVVTANTNLTTVHVVSNGTINVGATFSANANSTTFIGGNFTNNGTFTHNNGEVNFDGLDNANQQISGSSTFYNLVISTASNGVGRTLTFTDGSVTGVGGTWSVTGFSAKVITLRSSNSGNWTINPTAANVTYVNVSKSTNTGVTFCATYSSSGGGNTGWNISAGSDCLSQLTAYPFQRKTWYDGTRYWKSFNVNSQIEFWYSLNGTTWTENTDARIAVDTNDFSVEADSSNTFIAYTNGYDIEARKAGSIGVGFSWGSATTVYNGTSDTDKYDYPTLTRDANNKVWVSSSQTASSTPIFSDGFESGNLGSWTGSNALGTGTTAALQSEAYAGTWSGRFYRSDASDQLSGAFVYYDFSAPAGNIVWASCWARFDSIPSSSYNRINAILSLGTSNYAQTKARFHTRANSVLQWSYVNKDATWYNANWGTALSTGIYYGLKIKFDNSGVNPVITWYVNSGSGWTQVDQYTDTTAGTAYTPTRLRVGSALDTGVVPPDAYYTGTADTRIDEAVVSTSDPDAGGAYKFNAIESVSTNNITSWLTASSLNSSANSNQFGTIVPVGVGSSANMYAVWIDGTTIEGKKYVGVGETGWAGSPDSIGTGLTGMANSLSLVGGTGSMGANLIYVGAGGSAVYRRYTDSWQTAIALDTNSGNEYPSISVDNAGGDGLYAFWIRNDDIFYKRACSPYSSWGDIQTLEDTGTNNWLTTGYSTFGSGKIFGQWTSGAGLPYTVSWDSITPTACGGFSISGYIYQANESDLDITGYTVYLSVNNNSPSQTTASAGSFQFNNLTAAAGIPYLIYLYDNANNANLVSISGGTAVSNANLFVGKTSITNHNSDNTENTDVCAFIDYPASEEDETFTCSGTVPTFNGDELHLFGNYAPGGNVNTAKIHFKSGTYTGGSETLNITGSGIGTSSPFYVDGGTYTTGGNTIKYSGVSATDITAETYNNLMLSPSGAGDPTYTLGIGTGQTITASSSVTIGDGTNPVTVSTTTYSPVMNITGDLIVNGSATLSGTGTGTITANGNVKGIGTINLTAGTFEQRVAGNVGIGTTAGSNNWTFNNLVLSSGKVGAGVTAGSVNINDASNFGAMAGASRQVVRTSTGVLYALLVDDTNNDLEIWKSADGSSWTEQNVGVGPTGVYNNFAASTIDSTGVIHIVYASNQETVTYTSFDTGTDTFSGATQEIHVYNLGLTGTVKAVDITVDSYNYPHVVSTGLTTDGMGGGNIIYYKNQTGGTWRAEVQIDGGMSVDLYPISISIDSYDYPQISYIVGVSSWNLIAKVGNANNAVTFTSYTVDNSVNNTSGQEGCSLAVDSSGNTWIAYTDGSGYTSNQITFYKFAFGGTWTDSGSWTQYISSNIGYEPSIAVNGSDIYAFYKDSNNDIAYDKYDGSFWAGKTVLEGGTYQDSKVRWSYLNNASYTTYGIDYLFSDNNDVYWDKITFGGVATPITITANSGGSGSIGVGGTMQIGKTTDAGATTVNNETNDRTLDINGDFYNTANGIFSASSTTGMNIGGNFSNDGTFTANSGTVTFDDVTKTSAVTFGGVGSTQPFYNLFVTAAGKQMKFDETEMLNVGGSFFIQGTDCTDNRIFLDSTTNENKWDINVTGSADVDYADIEDSNAIVALTANDSTGTNNSGWAITAGACSAENQGPNSPTSLVQMKIDNSIIGAGTWINSTSISIGATASDPDASDTLYLCVENKTLGVGFTNVEDNCGVGVSYSGTAVGVGVTIVGLSDGTQYHWQVKAKDGAGVGSSWVAFGGGVTRDFGVDTSAPSGGLVYDGLDPDVDKTFNDGSLSSLSANWSGVNADVSGLNYYEYSIGTGIGATGVKNWANIGTGTSAVVIGLTLQTSTMYYFNVRGVDNAGNVQSPVISSNGQRISPSLTFSVSPPSLSFDNLNIGNSFSSTKQATLTTSTNAYGGYIIKTFATDFLRSGGVGYTIPDFNGGTYVSPKVWGEGNIGFGYTSSDATIQGLNKFGVGIGGTLYAPISQAGPGDIVADYTDNVLGSPITDDQYTITYKVKTGGTQQAANYSSTVVYTVTAIY